MSSWALIQIVFDIFAALGLFVVVMRMNRAPKDDPRLSRGLQLLQSKISVLEDLSDRTEVQVNQLTAILEQKSKEVQAKVQLAEQSVNEIRVSTERSLEVAKIFQDKIPHQEIIERQNTIKYVQAARLAHQGLGADEIAAQVDLPKGEIEFIASVNRERLMFNEEQLPAWAQDTVTGVESTVAFSTSGINASGYSSHTTATFDDDAFTAQANNVPAGLLPNQAESEHANRLRAEMDLAERQRLVENLSRLQFEMQSLDQQLAREGGARDFSQAFETPKVERASLQRLGEEFRRAVEDAKQENAQPPISQLTRQAHHAAPQVTATLQSVASKASSIFAPLEHLASLIPEVLGAPSFVNEASASSSGGSFANQARPFVPPPLPAQQNQSHQAQQQNQHASQAQPFAPPTRESAQAKVRSALERGNQGFGAAQRSTETPEELRNARAAAREVMQPQAKAAPQKPAQPAAERPHHVLSTRKGAPDPVVMKVMFPKIQDGEY